MAPTIPGDDPGKDSTSDPTNDLTSDLTNDPTKGLSKVSQPEVIRSVLTTPATWAVVGLSTQPARTAYGVARWLHDSLGQRIIPVHPRAEEVWGEPGYASLSDIPDGTAVAVVDCFVNSAKVGAVVDEAIANKTRLGIQTLWLQLGVIDQDAAQRAVGEGLDVVMDTCPMMEFPNL